MSARSTSCDSASIDSRPRKKMQPSSRRENNGDEVNGERSERAGADRQGPAIRPTREAGSRPMARTPRRHTDGRVHRAGRHPWLRRRSWRAGPACADRRAPGSRAAERIGMAEPRPVPRGLGAQLAAEQHDRAQVLRRGREPQLRHELTAPGERLEAEVAAEGETDRDDGDGEHDGERIERALVDAPERDVAREVGRRDPLPARWPSRSRSPRPRRPARR